MRRLLGLAVGVLAMAIAGLAAAQNAEFSDAEIAKLVRHAPWPPPFVPDPSNRVSGNAAGIALGRMLFFDTRLAPDGQTSCATCHDPARHWADGRPTSRVRGGDLVRNAPSLLDVRLQRWFGWDGAHDNLWAASLAPLLAPAEIGSTPARIAARIGDEPALARCYQAAFGRAPRSVDAQALAVDAAKALAAFQETLSSPRTAFDAFAQALAVGDRVLATRHLSPAAQRGAKLFVGRGNCAMCHLGPNFTSGEFHDIGVPFFVAGGGVDGGRHAGLQALAASPYTRAGAWSDDPVRDAGGVTRFVAPQHRDFGAFRIPSLRVAAATAPFMHNGSLATLADVVRHYSQLDPDRVHSDGEALLKALDLGADESGDLAAFLTALGTKLAPSASSGRAAEPTCER
jgi:cytochrome c peroxidase